MSNMHLCNMGGDPSLEPSNGGQLLWFFLIVIGLLYIYSKVIFRKQ